MIDNFNKHIHGKRRKEYHFLTYFIFPNGKENIVKWCALLEGFRHPDFGSQVMLLALHMAQLCWPQFKNLKFMEQKNTSQLSNFILKNRMLS